MMGLFSFCLYKLLHKMPTPLRTPQTSGYSSFHVSNLPLWSLKPPSSRRLKLSFFICPRVSARFLHCFCTVSRDAMGTLTCKIRQRVQKLLGGKSRCFAQKRRKLKTSKIRVFCPVGSFNQRARDSSSLERTKKPRRFVRVFAVFSFPESLYTTGADIENAIVHCYNKIMVLSPKIKMQSVCDWQTFRRNAW